VSKRASRRVCSVRASVRLCRKVRLWPSVRAFTAAKVQLRPSCGHQSASSGKSQQSQASSSGASSAFLAPRDSRKLKQRQRKNQRHQLSPGDLLVRFLCRSSLSPSLLPDGTLTRSPLCSNSKSTGDSLEEDSLSSAHFHFKPQLSSPAQSVCAAKQTDRRQFTHTRRPVFVCI